MVWNREPWRGLVCDVNDPALYEVVDPKVADVDVPGMLCSGTSSLDKLDGALVVFVHGHRGGV